MTDADLPTDSASDPDVTPTDESAADQSIRQGVEGTVGPYTVQPGRRMERDGVVLEAGSEVWFTPAEQSAGTVQMLIAQGTVA